MTVSLRALYGNMISDGSLRPTLPIVTKYADLSSVKLKFSMSISSQSSWVSGTSTSNLTYLQTLFIVASLLSQSIAMHWRWPGWFFMAEWTWFPVYMFDLDRYFLAFWDDSDFTTSVVLSPGVDWPPLAAGNLDLDDEFTDRPPLAAGNLDLDNKVTLFLRCWDKPQPAKRPH